MHVDCCAEARWIAAETGLDVELVHRVLIYDIRYMQELGIVDSEGGPAAEHDVQPAR